MKVVAALARCFRELYINATVYPFFLLTIYMQVAEALHWGLSWLRPYESILCLLSWGSGVFLTWKFSEEAWERYIGGQKWKRQRYYAWMVGACALIIALVALVAQIETVSTPKVLILLSFVFMMTNTWVLHESLDEKSGQAKKEAQSILTQPMNDES